MSFILIVIVLLLLFGGLGGGYYAHSNYGGYYGPGIGLGTVLVVVVQFLLFRGY
jgi:hypothetical protein